MISRIAGIFVTFVTGMAFADEPQRSQSLSDLNLGLDRNGISVSGVSSGGAMAMQFGMAYPEQVIAIGMVAGPIFDCAQGNLDTSLQRCMCCSTKNGVASNQPDTQAIFEKIVELSRQKLIGSLYEIARQKVWWFGSLADGTVRPPSSHSILDLYKMIYLNVYGDTEWKARFISNIHPNGFSDPEPSHDELLARVMAAHAQISPRADRGCAEKGWPFLVKCGDFDQAGQILEAAYGALSAEEREAAKNPTVPSGEMITIKQDEYTAAGFAITGKLYVPTECRQSQASNAQKCRLHIAFHGCKMYQDDNTYQSRAGYNQWADKYRVVVLYPRIAPSPDIGLNLGESCEGYYNGKPGTWDATLHYTNFNGCWDWWGYSDPQNNSNAHLTRDGKQIKAIKAMVDALTGQHIGNSTGQP